MRDLLHVNPYLCLTSLRDLVYCANILSPKYIAYLPYSPLVITSEIYKGQVILPKALVL